MTNHYTPGDNVIFTDSDALTFPAVVERVDGARIVIACNEEILLVTADDIQPADPS